MDIKHFEQKLSVISGALKEELQGIRTNRPTAKLVENIKVDAYGQQMTVKQLGSISIVPPREIDISVWDKEVIHAVAKAIEDAGLGVTANTEGALIRIHLPTLTDERRKELIKLVKSLIEEARIKVRGARDEANKELEKRLKEGTLSEDQKFTQKEKVQVAVDAANKAIEEMLENKMSEIEAP